MWDFEQQPLNADLARRYEIDWMLPSECADRLANRTADIGLVPIAALATQDGERAREMCVRLSEFLRATLTLNGKEATPLGEDSQRSRGHGKPHDARILAHPVSQVGQF